MHTLPPSRSGLTTSIPATGAGAQDPHDLVHVMLEHACAGHSAWPWTLVTAPVRLKLTCPQYVGGTSTASLYMLLLPGYCISLAVAPTGPVTVKSVVFREGTGSDMAIKKVEVDAVVVGTPLGYDIWVA